MPAERSESPELQFARQLHDRCVERHGPDHQQTRLAWDHLAAVEGRDLAKVNEVVLAQFNRLIEDLLAGSIQRSKFEAWEIDILLDAMTCDLDQFPRADVILRKYQAAVQVQMAKGTHLPMKLSEFLASSAAPSRKSARA